jgi:hypothetical protein
VKVNAVEQRAADARTIALDLRGGAAALPPWISQIATRAALRCLSTT